MDESDKPSRGAKEGVKEYFSEVCIPFPSNHHATMVKDCLDVDEELQPSRLSKVLSVEGNVLRMLVVSMIVFSDLACCIENLRPQM